MSEIVENMISFIEKQEKELQASKLTDSNNKNSIVNAILSELDSEVENEN